MSLLDIMLNRRSVRAYKDGRVSDNDLNKILTAGLSIPTGRNNRRHHAGLVRPGFRSGACAGTGLSEDRRS